METRLVDRNIALYSILYTIRVHEISIQCGICMELI